MRGGMLGLRSTSPISGIVVALFLQLAGEDQGSAAEREPQLVGKPEVERLILRLGFPELRERERAERRLIALGPSILGSLATTRDPLSAEARLRLARVMATLETTLTERSIEPSTLDLIVDDEPIDTVLDRIAAETGNILPSVPRFEFARAVSLREKGATYWQIIEEILPQAGLTLAMTPAGLRMEDAADGMTRGVAAGPLLVRARASRRAVPEETVIGKRRGVRVEVRAAWEPRLEPLIARLPMGSVQVDGPAGEALAPSSRRGVLEASVRRDVGWVSFPLVVEDPDRLAIESITVRGTMVMVVAGADHVFHFPVGPAGGQARQKVGDATVAIRSVRRAGERLEIIAEVSYESAGEALASHRRALMDRGLRLVRLEMEDAFRAVRDVPMANDARPSTHGLPAGGPALLADPLEQEVAERHDRGWTVRTVFGPVSNDDAVTPGDSDGGRVWLADKGDPGEDWGSAAVLAVTWRLPISIHEMAVDFVVPGVMVEAAEGPP